MFEKSRLLSALPALRDRRVLVLGDVMLDVYDFCRSSESKPIDSEKPGKRAYTAHESVQRLGGAGNVAANLVTLDARACLLGLTGDDGPGHTVRGLCQLAGLQHALLPDPDRPTTCKTRLYIDEEYILRKDHESTQPAAPGITRQLTAMMRAEMEAGADAVIFSDYQKGVFTRPLAEGILKSCRDANLPVVVDFKPANRTLFEGAGLLVPNESEADALLPGFKNSTDLQQALLALKISLRAGSVVVTLGARGICGWDENEGFFHHPGHSVNAVDAVGCGDTVRAVIALGLASGLPLAMAAALANHAAAVIVQKPATASLTPAELAEFISNS